MGIKFFRRVHRWLPPGLFSLSLWLDILWERCIRVGPNRLQHTPCRLIWTHTRTHTQAYLNLWILKLLKIHLLHYTDPTYLKIFIALSTDQLAVTGVFRFIWGVENFSHISWIITFKYLHKNILLNSAIEFDRVRTLANKSLIRWSMTARVGTLSPITWMLMFSGALRGMQTIAQEPYSRFINSDIFSDSLETFQDKSVT